jgi:hypothetical protein
MASNHPGNANQNHNTTLHLLGWLLQKIQEISNIGKDVEKGDSFYTFGGNVNWYSNYRK